MIKVEKILYDKIKPFSLGIFEADSIVCKSSEEELIERIKQAEIRIGSDYTLDNINAQQEISVTRATYRKLGNDPNRYRPSADSLYRRIVKGLGIYYINNLVDIINLLSLETGFSIGGYDANRIDGQIELGIGREKEIYEGIGRGNMNISKLPVLRDDKGAFGNPTSDSERTRITSSTSRILLVIYSFGEADNLSGVLENTDKLIEKFAEADITRQQILQFS